jgi:hypothetical protein
MADAQHGDEYVGLPLLACQRIRDPWELVSDPIDLHGFARIHFLVIHERALAGAAKLLEDRAKMRVLHSVGVLLDVLIQRILLLRGLSSRSSLLSPAFRPC